MNTLEAEVIMSNNEVLDVVLQIKHLTCPRTLKDEAQSSTDRKMARELAHKHGFEYPEDLLEAWQ